MIIDQFRLDNQAAIVTGAHQGIGQGIAVGLAEAGADIVAFDRSEPADTRAAVEAAGRRFFWLKLDLSTATPQDLHEAVGDAIGQAGRLDILVNNAGITGRAGVLDYTEEMWDSVVQVDMKAVFFLCQAAARHFAAQKRGKIINIASMMSFQGGIRIAAYTASKSAVAGMTRTMSNELAPLGINVNAIAPGYILTNHTQSLYEDASRLPAIMARIPAGRWGGPQDIAGAAVYLASAASDYCSGMILSIDGGWLGALTR